MPPRGGAEPCEDLLTHCPGAASAWSGPGVPAHSCRALPSPPAWSHWPGRAFACLVLTPLRSPGACTEVRACTSAFTPESRQAGRCFYLGSPSDPNTEARAGLLRGMPTLLHMSPGPGQASCRPRAQLARPSAGKQAPRAATARSGAAGGAPAQAGAAWTASVPR